MSIVTCYAFFLVSMVYCSGSSIKLLSALFVKAVCQDSKVLRVRIRQRKSLAIFLVRIMHNKVWDMINFFRSRAHGDKTKKEKIT